MLSAVLIRNSTLINTGILCTGAVVGGWLVLRPEHLLSLLGLPTDASKLSHFLTQILGQLLLGIVLIPVIITMTRWLYGW
ncbi:MAG: hypothetical protein AAFV98_10450 [Chloroflexota bacterium]